jgi:hypothetical protein
MPAAKGVPGELVILYIDGPPPDAVTVRRPSMSFSLEKLFVDVFAPRRGEVVTIMYDLPHGDVRDSDKWKERRAMAEDWQRQIAGFSTKYGMRIGPVVTYEGTGANGRQLPVNGLQAGRPVRLDDVAAGSTIIISMPQYSASAPLVLLTRKYPNLRVASLPGVQRSMEKTGLSADYSHIAATCATLAGIFDGSVGVEVEFSTGHTCYFDKSDGMRAIADDGRLPPVTKQGELRLRNLPSGEVFVVPNESPGSKTAGQIPVSYGSEMVVLTVQNNQIVDVRGDGPVAARKREEFRAERAMCNIAEVAIGCNDKAVVTGNVLEDEKAGFHWAYGRSDHLGGKVRPQDFSAPAKVIHQDIVYAKGNPIVCKRLDFLSPDGRRRTVIRDGVLLV